jgi:hypothetical protein
MLWLAVRGQGLLRSTSSGQSWSKVAGAPADVRCLARRGARVLLCGDAYYDGFGVAAYDPASGTFTPVLRFGDITGAASCGPGSAVTTSCAPLFAALEAQFNIPAAASQNQGIIYEPPPASSGGGCRAVPGDLDDARAAASAGRAGAALVVLLGLLAASRGPQSLRLGRRRGRGAVTSRG